MAPNRYVFPGAEVYENDDESDLSSNHSGSDTDSDDEADSSDHDKQPNNEQQPDQSDLNCHRQQQQLNQKLSRLKSESPEKPQEESSSSKEATKEV